MQVLPRGGGQGARAAAESALCKGAPGEARILTQRKLQRNYWQNHLSEYLCGNYFTKTLLTRNLPNVQESKESYFVALRRKPDTQRKDVFGDGG